MRSTTLLLVLVGSLSTFACKRESQDSTPPDDTATTEPTPEPEPAPEPAPAGTMNPEFEAVCEHMMDLFQADLGDTMEITPDVREQSKLACSGGLDKAKAEKSPEEFARILECNLTAATLEAATTCEAG